jgi:hypothetical protein
MWNMLECGSLAAEQYDSLRHGKSHSHSNNLCITHSSVGTLHYLLALPVCVHSLREPEGVILLAVTQKSVYLVIP